MGIDTSIYGNIQQYKAPDQLNQIAQMMQIQGAQNQGALAQYTLKKAQREDEDNNALRAALSAPGADVGNALLQQGRVKEYSDYQKAQADAGKLKAETSKFDAETESKKLEAAHKRVDMFGQAAGWLRQNPTPENAIAVTQHLVQNGILTPEQAQASVAKIQADPSPEGISRMATMAYQTALSAKDQLPQYQTRNTGGATDTIAIDPVTGKVSVASSVKNTQSPDNAATNSTHLQGINIQQAGENARQKQTLAKDFAVAGLNPDGTDPSGTVGGLTPQAIDNAAKRYNFDGTLPPSIGRGTQGSRDLRAIQNRAAELNGAAPDDASGGRAGQMANKADAAAFSKLNSQQQMASSFERTANANADIALGLSKKMDRTGVPIINAGIQAWRTGTGSPEATQFAAANETFVNEYAKIMSGGMGSGPVTDGARNKAHSLLSTSMTADQYEGNVKLLQREMQNRMKGYQDQADEIKTRMHGGATPAAGAPAAGTKAPVLGAVQDGYRFKGGNPADPHSWEKQ